jgi:hypothetical protein
MILQQIAGYKRKLNKFSKTILTKESIKYRGNVGIGFFE